jgi:hypothetical protein
MKKSLIIFGILLAGSTFFASCNKNLKDDIKNLRQQVDSLKKHNSELQDQIGGVENILGSNEPISVTTTFKDNNDSTRTITAIHKFKSADNETQSLAKLADGNYSIYIERFSDVEWYEGAWVSFTYNPTTKAITNKRGGQYWYDNDSYDNYARYDDNYANLGGLTFDINIKSINLTTGDISLTFTGSATSAYTSGVPYYYRPNAGKPMSTTFSFTGKLKLFTQN